MNMHVRSIQVGIQEGPNQVEWKHSSSVLAQFGHHSVLDTWHHLNEKRTKVQTSAIIAPNLTCDIMHLEVSGLPQITRH